MANNDFELRIYIPLTLDNAHYSGLPSKEDAIEHSILCSPAVGIFDKIPHYEEEGNGSDSAEVKISESQLYEQMGINFDKLQFLTKGKTTPTQEWFYPYGMMLCYTEYTDELLKDVCTLLKSVKLRDFNDNSSSNEHHFTIDYNPTIFIKCNETTYGNVTKWLSISPSKEEKDKAYQMYNPVVIFNVNETESDSTVDAIDLSLKIISAINGLCYKARVKLKKALGNDLPTCRINYSDELLEVQQLCSVVKEICSNTVVKSNIEKRVFDEMMEAFKIKEALSQIDNSLKTIEYVNNKEINKKAEKINKKAERINTTVFITGYLSLILAVFAFMPLNFGDLLWFRIPDSYYPLRWAAFISIVALTVLLCRSIYIFYKHFDNKGIGIKSNKKQPKKCQKGSNRTKNIIRTTKTETEEKKKQNGKEPRIERIEKCILKRAEFLEKSAILIILILLIFILITVVIFCFLSMLGKYQVHL